MAQTKKYKPGENCETSGKYQEYDESGKLVNEDIDMEAGHRFPPSQKKGCYYVKQK